MGVDVPMKKEITPHLIIGIAIVLAALIHGLCLRYETVVASPPASEEDRSHFPYAYTTDRLTGKVWFVMVSETFPVQETSRRFNTAAK